MKLRFWRKPPPEPEPDWVALVAAVELAGDIASPPLFGERTTPRWKVLGHPYLTPRQVAQRVADFWYLSWLREDVDGELFALEAALAGFWERPADEAGT